MHDLILVGGGLANGLLAWRLRQVRPEWRILLLEKSSTLGGNHTWSFYERDLTAAQRAWIEPLVVQRWPAYEVRFPAHRRQLDTPCYSISSERFHEVLTASLGDGIRLDASVSDVCRDSVRIDGELLHARAVIDGRGYLPTDSMQTAWQKFVGREVLLRRAHGQSHPVIMDATVEQQDGYRFVYTLPFDARRILVEDTYYSDTATLDLDTIRRRIDAYIVERGWTVERVLREETGVLPIALSGDIEALWKDRPPGLPCVGLRAGLFHATTGYSLLYAVRLADEIAGMVSIDAEAAYLRIKEFSVRQWRAQSFMRALNRMLFFASRPDRRYRLLERFYRLPQPLIERFYAAQPRLTDKIRILSGKPPVPVRAAMQALFQRQPAEATAAAAMEKAAEPAHARRRPSFTEKEPSSKRS